MLTPLSLLTQASTAATLPRSGLYPAPEHYSESYTSLHHLHTLANRNELCKQRPLALQIRIPFCDALCWHCTRKAVHVGQAQEINDYLEALAHEMRLVSQALPARVTLHKLHLIGGAPSLLTPQQLERLWQHIHRYFDVSPDMYAGLEADPRHITAELLAHWVSLGFNALYLTLTENDPVMLRAISRDAPPWSTADMISLARTAGFRDIRVEVLTGLPHQTTKRFHDQLQQLQQVPPDLLRLSAYWHQPHLYPTQRNIQAETLAEHQPLLNLARQQLLSTGWRHLGLDSFVAPESPLHDASQAACLRLDGPDYHALPEYDCIGLGLSAISRVGRAYAQNHRHLSDYLESLAQHQLPTQRGHVLSADDLARQAIIHGLFCQGEVDFQALAEDHLIDFKQHFRHEQRSLDNFVRQGWIWLTPQGFGTTAAGHFELPVIAAVFDRAGQLTRRWLQPY